MREYLIAAPQYAHMCGGIKSLHYLCHKLNERGVKAYVPGGYTNPNLNTPRASDLSQEHLKDLQQNGVIVYPDIIPNNPAHFTHCCKWWMGVTQPPPVNQIVFAFSDMHQCITKTKYNLAAIYFEDFFKEPEIENRYTNCCYAGKGGGILVKQVPEIGTLEDERNYGIPGCVRILGGYPAQRIELATLLQSSKIFYSYDNLTVMNTEARLCGTPVILLGHWVIPPEQFAKDPFSMYGIGMYDDKPDIEKLKSELPLFKEAFHKFHENTEKEIDIFIEETQKWNPNNIYIDDPAPPEYMHNFYGHPQLALWKTR